MKNILVIGGTGYIGGPILSRFLSGRATDVRITALVRSKDKAEKLRAIAGSGKLNKDLVVVEGTHNDAELVERLVADADVVISMADCDDLQGMQCILRGLKTRYATTNKKPILIHMSGTGFLGDNANGAFASTKVYNDLDIPSIEALPATQNHRPVDLAVVAADKEGYTQTYIVVPGVVYGVPRGVVAEQGAQNTINFAWTLLFKTSIERGAAVIMGEGKNLVAHVEVNEVADLVELLYDAIQAGTAAHGREGYYFVANGSAAFSRLVEIVETRTGPRRQLSAEEIQKYMPDPGFTGVRSFFGDNGVAVSARGIALGWKPVFGTEDFIESVKDEIVRFVA